MKIVISVYICYIHEEVKLPFSEIRQHETWTGRSDKWAKWTEDIKSINHETLAIPLASLPTSLQMGGQKTSQADAMARADGQFTGVGINTTSKLDLRKIKEPEACRCL